MNANGLLESSKITMVGNGVFHIASESKKDAFYTVDVMDNDGLGGCDCKNFLFSKLPKFERNGRIIFESLRCKHLRRVRSFAFDLIIMQQLRKQQQTHGK